MMQGRSLDALGGELMRIEAMKRDFVAPAERIRIETNGHTNMVLNETYQVNDISHGQIATYLDIPKVHYDRLRGATDTVHVKLFDESRECFNRSSPLFDVTVNLLMGARGDDRRMVRTLDGHVRAFLSDSYNPDLDNLCVLRAAAHAIEQAGLGPENVASCEVTERRLYLKVLSPKLEAVIEPSNLTMPHGDHHMLKEPQVVQAGFILMNSETGLGSLSIQQVVYKLMCTNLWIMEEGYRQRHVGRALETTDDGSVYRSDTREAEAHAKLLKLRDHVSDALNENRFKTLVGKMQETTTIPLEGSVDKIMEVTARKFGLSVSEKDATLRNLITGGDLSLWGLSNAVTATAQRVTDYDRATELEAAGGRFFGLDKREIREIVCAG